MNVPDLSTKLKRNVYNSTFLYHKANACFSLYLTVVWLLHF